MKKAGKKIAVSVLIAAIGVSAVPLETMPLQVQAKQELLSTTVDGMVIENGILRRYEGEQENLVVPDGVIAVGDYAFEYKDGIKSITLPETVKEIGERTFFKCSNLESVYSQGSIETIGTNSFSQCKKLTQIDLSNVKEVGYHAFGDCESLKEIQLDNVELIRGTAFEETGLEKAVLNFNTEAGEIQYQAFCHCPNLKTVEIKGNLSKIDDEAFSWCGALEEIQMENSAAITYIGIRVFDRTPWLSRQLNQSETKMLIINHILVSYQPNTFYAGEYLGVPYDELSYEQQDVGQSIVTADNFTYTPPTGVEMETVYIPADVKAIAGGAFYGAYSVKEIQFDSQIKNLEIGEEAFDFCTWELDYMEKNNFLVIGGNLLKVKCNAEILQLPNGVKNVIRGCYMAGGYYKKILTEEVVPAKKIIYPQSVVSAYWWSFVPSGWDAVEVILPSCAEEKRASSANASIVFQDVDTDIEVEDVLPGYRAEEMPTPTITEEPEKTPTPTITEEPEKTPTPIVSKTPTQTVSNTPVPTQVSKAILVHFKSPNGTAKLSYWNGSGAESNPNAWSEVEMEPEGGDWYKYILGDLEATNIIFKYEGGETEKLYITSGERWYDSGKWYMQKPEEKITPVITQEPTIIVEPTTEPTLEPTIKPTLEPTIEPTDEPEPTLEPTIEPTDEPEPTITAEPTATVKPTQEVKPTETAKPTQAAKPTSTLKPTQKVTVKKAVISKVKRVSSTKLKVTMKKKEKVKGYQLMLSTDKKFKKNVRKITFAKQSVTITKLKKGKNYYVKVRAYKLDSNKKKVYGKYSSVKMVRKK